MKSFVMLLDSDRTYTEADINAAVRDWQRRVAPAVVTDHVTVRRLLVDHGHLERTPDGRAYRVGFPARPFAFDLDVDEIDVRATVEAYRSGRERRRIERKREEELG